MAWQKWNRRHTQIVDSLHNNTNDTIISSMSVIVRDQCQAYVCSWNKNNKLTITLTRIFYVVQRLWFYSMAYDVFNALLL